MLPGAAHEIYDAPVADGSRAASHSAYTFPPDPGARSVAAGGGGGR